MNLLNQKPALGGGATRSGGSLYHLSFRSGSRASGASARASCEYVTREGEYDYPDRDPVIYTESGHMPSWAADDPSSYWDAADLYERANGRLFVAADFALPCDLPFDTKVELAHEFATRVTERESLPYTLAIHAGLGPGGEEHNPHVHLMFSERRNDGIERAREDWFRRADSKSPADGGAAKSRTFHGAGWVEQARSHWADLVNDALKRQGRAESVDHRSYARQGIQREPGEHYGPAGASMLERAGAHDRLESAASKEGHYRDPGWLEAEIASVEVLRTELLREALADADRPGGRSAQSERDDDYSRGR